MNSMKEVSVMLTRVLRVHVPEKCLRKFILQRVIGIVCRLELAWIREELRCLPESVWSGKCVIVKTFKTVNKKRLLF